MERIVGIVGESKGESRRIMGEEIIHNVVVFATVEKIPLLLPPKKSNSGGKQREQSTADRPTDETPYLNLSTNISLDCVDTSYILSEATSTFTKLIGKPEAYVMIMLKDLCLWHLVGLSSQQPTVN
ncbi:hypothetical protein LguiB_000823 [Lonicera macranthoides]